MQSVSFIVTAREEPPDILASTVDGLLRTSAAYRRQIVLIDDASREPVRLERPDLMLVRNESPVGVSPSRRQGAALSTGDVLVWVDAHMSFAPDWLDRMMEHVESGVLLCASWWDYELSRALCWGADFVWCGDRDYTAGRSPGLSFKHRTKRPPDGSVDVPMVIGACYMMARQTYECLGGFSPFFRTWGKAEQDISMRAQIMGFGVRCVTGAKVGHLSRAKFPYPVRWDDIEFNQLSIVRTVFEEEFARRIEELLNPLPERVRTWLEQSDFGMWRQQIQSRRRMRDVEFFREFVRDAPECLLS